MPRRDDLPPLRYLGLPHEMIYSHDSGEFYTAMLTDKVRVFVWHKVMGKIELCVECDYNKPHLDIFRQYTHSGDGYVDFLPTETEPLVLASYLHDLRAKFLEAGNGPWPEPPLRG